ncbi:MAG: DUF3310 domain-containing protein [Clostridia bacterium]|nr:DUF3310 domain-containing protein [Clostridia bacterium]
MKESGITIPGVDKRDGAFSQSSPADPTDPVHYRRWEIEPLEFISRNRLDYIRGNIIKYIMRYDMKGGVEDLRKARVYLDRLIEDAGK